MTLRKYSHKTNTGFDTSILSLMLLVQLNRRFVASCYKYQEIKLSTLLCSPVTEAVRGTALTAQQCLYRNQCGRINLGTEIISKLSSEKIFNYFM